MRPARLMSRRDIGQDLYAHMEPGSTRVCAVECLLCREIIYQKGPEAYVASGLVKVILLHFLLAHDIEATDIPSRR